MKTEHISDHANPMRGIVSFRMILIIGSVVTLAIILLAASTAPPKQDAAGQQAAGTRDPATNTNNAPVDGSPSDRPADSDKIVRIPEDFRRFTSKQYGFTVAYPEAWGNLLTKPNTGGSLLLAETTQVRYPLGGAEANGQFLVAVYPASAFTVGIRPAKPLVRAEENSGKVSWKVVSADITDGYRLGDAYPVGTVATASGLTAYDFTWVLNGKRQSRWAYKSGNTYVLMTVPPLSRADGREPTGSDLSFYADFAQSIRDTAGVPKQ